MSHFTVLVIGENPEEQLQPYHEYECTGVKDQYVIDVDKTDEVNEWLQEEIFIGNKKDNGDLDYEFSEEKATETLVAPRKAQRKEYLQASGKDIDEEIREYHGYEKNGEKWTRFTNPNKKWDWYVLGGRWTGFFKLKHACVGEVGQPGVFGDPADDGYVDAAQKKDIDFEGMRDDAASKAAERYDKVMVLISHLPVNKSWEEMQELYKDNVREAREIYWKQERCAAFNDSRELFEIGHNPDEFLIDRDVYIQNARNNAVSTFAVVKDGKWYERGEMGWWACVSNEKDKDQWNEEFAKLLDSVPDDTLLSVYDCHI